MSTKQVRGMSALRCFFQEFAGYKRSILPVLLLLFLPVWTSGSVKGPTPPAEPQVQTFEDDKARESETTPDPHEEKGTWYNVEIFLEDGRRISGRIPVEYEQFEVSHEVDGVEYKKRIHFKNVVLFEIVSWKEMASSRAEGMYYVMPDVYRIRTDEGLEVMVHKRFQMFDEFVLRNVSGEARFFTYFVDYWIGDEESGHWENSNSRDFSHVRFRPLGRVVRRIIFLQDSGD